MGSLFERQMKALLLFDGQSDSEWRVGELKFRDASEGFDLNLGADGRKWKRCRQPVCQKDFRVAMGLAHKICTVEAHRAFLVRLLEYFPVGSVQCSVGKRRRGGCSPTREMNTDRIRELWEESLKPDGHGKQGRTVFGQLVISSSVCSVGENNKEIGGSECTLCGAERP